MENLYTVWKDFFTKYDELLTCVSAVAKRSGLTERQALALILLNDFPEKSVLADTKDLEGLFLKGLARIDNGKTVLTGKGAILAKSLIMHLSK